MSKNNNKFNITKQSLEEVLIESYETGVKQVYPALSEYYAVKKQFPSFIKPPKLLTEASKENWLKRIEIFNESVTFLNHLEHHEFWSTLVFTDCSKIVLCSFLSNAYPFYHIDLISTDDDIKQVYYTTASLIFTLWCRINTQFESENKWINTHKYWELIYDNYIITLPIMIDLCAIYGNSNKKILQTQLLRVFENQSKFLNDFSKIVPNIVNVFKSIEENLRLISFDSNVTDKSLIALEDNIFFLLDTTASIFYFVECCSLASKIFHDEHLELIVSNFYDNVIIQLANKLKRLFIDENKVEMYFNLTSKFNQSRFYLINLFHSCITQSVNYVITAINEMDEVNLRKQIDSYTSILNDCLNEKYFLDDYNNLYPIQEVAQNYTDLLKKKEYFKPDLYLSSLKSLVAEISNEKIKGKNSNSISTSNEIQLSTNINNEISEPSEMELICLISEVKDILPDADDKFVERCLKAFNYNSSSVINSILENSVDINLLMAEEDIKNKHSINTFNVEEINKSAINTLNSKDYISNRLSASSSNRISNKGKDHKNYNDVCDILNDKCHINEVRHIYSKFDLVEGNESNDQYNDEYDDTYDDVPVPCTEAETEARPFVLPRVLQQYTKVDTNEQSSEEENSQEENSSYLKNIPFVENPEIVRERQQRKWQESRNRPGTVKERDQSSLQQRNKKNTHKQFIGNHNRRNLSNRKRNQ